MQPLKRSLTELNWLQSLACPCTQAHRMFEGFPQEGPNHCSDLSITAPSTTHEGKHCSALRHALGSCGHTTMHQKLSDMKHASQYNCLFLRSRLAQSISMQTTKATRTKTRLCVIIMYPNKQVIAWLCVPVRADVIVCEAVTLRSM